MGESTESPASAGSTDGETTSGGSLDSGSGSGSGSGTGSGSIFECPEGRWHEGDLEVEDGTDLQTLADVAGITGDLTVAGTSQIENLDFLSCLEIVEGTLLIQQNAALVSLQGLERLRLVQDDPAPGFRPWDLAIRENPILLSVDSIDSLENVGIVVIEGNESLASIRFEALREADWFVLGPLCAWPDTPTPVQPITTTGEFPSIEHFGSFSVHAQTGVASLEQLISLANNSVVFSEADFRLNSSLSLSEIDAFAMAAGIEPLSCWNQGERTACPQCPTD